MIYEEPDIELSDIDLRQEFEGLKNEFNLKVLLIRTNQRTRCKCYDPYNHDGDSNCKICGGTGKLNMIEMTPTIHENFNTSSLIKMTELGLSVSNTILLFFDYKVIPKVRDRVLIVGYDSRGIPVDIKKDCTIASVEEVRGENGRIELYMVYAKYSPENIKRDQRRLNRIPPKVKKEIMKGRRYTWPQDM